jgi:anion-transporting  ArsA/GET3 family ATPase
MGKVIYAAGEGVPGIGPVDCVILDAPATGHGIALVRAPSVVAETVPTGPLAEDAVHLSRTLADPAFSRFHIVTVPEEMPIAESVEAYRALGTGMSLPFGPILLNQVSAPGLVGREVEALSSLMGSRPSAGVCATAGAALFMSARAEMQRAHVHRLRRSVPLPVVQLPDVHGQRSIRDRLDIIAQHLDAALWREAR